MRKITGNKGRLFSRGTAAGLVLLLVLAGWPKAAAGNSELDWPKVQAVKPGTPIKVVLHKNRGPRGDRKVRGRFQSATEDSLTLQMEYGPMRTLPRSAVRSVLTRRPVWKRYQGWVTLGLALAISSAASGDFDDPKGPFIAISTCLATLIALAVAPKMGGIYHVPPKHRAQLQKDKPSGSESKAPGKQKQP